MSKVWRPRNYTPLSCTERCCNTTKNKTKARAPGHIFRFLNTVTTVPILISATFSWILLDWCRNIYVFLSVFSVYWHRDKQKKIKSNLKCSLIEPKDKVEHSIDWLAGKQMSSIGFSTADKMAGRGGRCSLHTVIGHVWIHWAAGFKKPATALDRRYLFCMCKNWSCATSVRGSVKHWTPSQQLLLGRRRRTGAPVHWCQVASSRLNQVTAGNMQNIHLGVFVLFCFF